MDVDDRPATTPPLDYATPAPPAARRRTMLFLCGTILAVLLIATGVGFTVGGLMAAMGFDEESALAIGFGVGLTILGIGTLLTLFLLRVRQQFQAQ